MKYVILSLLALTSTFALNLTPRENHAYYAKPCKNLNDCPLGQVCGRTSYGNICEDY